MDQHFVNTRLAPSPTGALHLGHARTFLVTWWMARQVGAKVYLRMEDLDVGRVKAESVRQAGEDLRWLGMRCDAWEGENEARGAVVQSERLGVYRGVLQQLWERGAVYPCTCTREEVKAAVEASASAPHEGEGELRYPGTCRGNLERGGRGGGGEHVDAVEATIRAETGREVCWRLRVEVGAISFEDVIAGRRTFDVWREVGDFAVVRFDGMPSYQLACVVDDHAMGIDMVVRGDDLLSSTPRQMLLYRLLGWEVPRFAHVPLVIGTNGRRLAKRHGESRLGQFRKRGVSAEKVVGWVAWRSGQIEALREATAAEVGEGFELRKVPRERMVLDERDLAWLV